MNATGLFVYIILGLILSLGACSETPEQTQTAETQEAPPEPVDGQTAFFRMFVAARGWASDAEGLRLDSMELAEVPSDGAKFGVWRATFVSPSKNRVASFNYSAVNAGGKFQKGVFQDHEEAYSQGRSHPWPVSALKISSEKALEVALEQPQTKEYVAKHPDMPHTFVLELTSRHPNLTWRVIWGEKVSTSGFSVFVDASSGDYLEVMR